MGAEKPEEYPVASIHCEKDHDVDGGKRAGSFTSAAQVVSMQKKRGRGLICQHRGPSATRLRKFLMLNGGMSAAPARVEALKASSKQYHEGAEGLQRVRTGSLSERRAKSHPGR